MDRLSKATGPESTSGFSQAVLQDCSLGKLKCELQSCPKRARPNGVYKGLEGFVRVHKGVYKISHGFMRVYEGLGFMV